MSTVFLDINSFLTDRERWCIQRFNHWIGVAKEKFGDFPVPEMRFSTSLRTTAGLAHYPNKKHPSGLVELASRFINQPDFDSTIAHEIAHIVAVAKFGLLNGRGHGQCWRYVMTMMGQVPRRCHNYCSNIAAQSSQPRSFTQK